MLTAPDLGDAPAAPGTGATAAGLPPTDNSCRPNAETIANWLLSGVED